MSKIVVVIKEDPPSQLFVEIAGVCNTSISIIRQAVKQRQPVFEARLFYNDHAEVAAQLLQVVGAIKSHKVKYSIYELDYDERLEDVPSEEVEIDENILRNILKEWDDGLKKIQEE